MNFSYLTVRHKGTFYLMSDGLPDLELPNIYFFHSNEFRLSFNIYYSHSLFQRLLSTYIYIETFPEWNDEWTADKVMEVTLSKKAIALVRQKVDEI